jgi:hypothetical protein
MNLHNLWNRNGGKKQDDIKRRASGQRAALYYLVALYIGYMGFCVMKNRLAGDDTMTYPLAVILSSALFIGAVFVAWYATRRMKRELKQSMTETAGNEENKE